ncbi:MULTISPECIES: fasciclin domain-containing protein [unclassified Brevibacterium]|uniref:fasciclin domain-containing protein n=1 Tax=unclassified Brevibacterium TaxID=2614124 RepID=UPI0010925ACC|nr:fasciclin domain-containing protein [Brevibacterium sp. S22]TGD29783.1 fasciclin domain-containing protein [Brevibacterium sp. S22]
MKTLLRTRTATILSAGAIGLLALSGCSGMDSGSDGEESGSDSGSSESQPADSGESEMPDESGDSSMDDADLVGSGCSTYAEENPDGGGSVEGMAQDPVATAASNNPMLTTLTQAVSGELNPDVDLVDTLNGDEFTVIAPVDDAFADVPKDDLDALAKDSDQLTKVLTYHVIPGQLSPDEIAGEHETVEGSKVKVSGEGEDMKFDDAGLVCGGVKTANATVYMVDGVMMPEK